MADKTDAPRIYGAPDEEKQIPPAPEGLRGEGTSSLLEGKEEQTHTIVAEGRTIKVAEESGRAFAESGGAGDGEDGG